MMVDDLVNYYRNLVPPNFGSEAPEKYGVMIFASKAKETADEIERLRWALEFILGVDRINDAHIAARAALGEDKE